MAKAQLLLKDIENTDREYLIDSAQNVMTSRFEILGCNLPVKRVQTMAVEQTIAGGRDPSLESVSHKFQQIALFRTRLYLNTERRKWRSSTTSQVCINTQLL